MGAGGVDGVTEAGGVVGVQAGVEIEGTAQGGAALVGEEEEDLGVDKHQGQVAAAAPEHAQLQVSMQECTCYPGGFPLPDRLGIRGSDEKLDVKSASGRI